MHVLEEDIVLIEVQLFDMEYATTPIVSSSVLAD
jgi:hypothetical protein